MKSVAFIRAILSATCVLLGSVNGFADREYKNWSRDVVESATSQNIPLMPFYVGVITSVDGRLSALCGYHYVKPTKIVALRGRRDSDGNLWPVVSCDVATTGKTTWRTISKSHVPVDSKVVNISSDNQAQLYVDMESFRPFIGDFRWGRVVLESGDTAIFALEDLLPPGDRRGLGHDFKAVLEERVQTQFGSSAILHSVISIRDHLTGVFIYNRSRAPVTLRGARTTDGDFWPSVTLFVGDSERDWGALGRAKTEGTPDSIDYSEESSPVVLRVKLDAYKSTIGHKYGKVIFSDGTFAVFLVQSLNPKAE
jgi:hypothetical protein